MATLSTARTTLDFDCPSDSEDSDNWILLDDGVMKGVNIVVDNKSGNVIQLSTRFTKDQDRWTTNDNDGMPSLEGYSSSLQILDLHNSRYLTSLHDSVTSLGRLRKLILTSCDRLERLPDSLGRNEQLQEVRTISIILYARQTHGRVHAMLMSSVALRLRFLGVRFLWCLSHVLIIPLLCFFLVDPDGQSSHFLPTRIDW